VILLEALTVGIEVAGELVEGLGVGLGVDGVFSLLGCGLVIAGGLFVPFDELVGLVLLHAVVVMVKTNAMKTRPNLFNFIYIFSLKTFELFYRHFWTIFIIFLQVLIPFYKNSLVPLLSFFLNPLFSLSSLPSWGSVHISSKNSIEIQSTH